MSAPWMNDSEAHQVRQAISWVVRLQHTDDPELHRACEQWRGQNASHERVWQRVSGMHRELARDLATLPGGTVDALENSSRRLQRRQALKLLSFAAVAGGSVWLGRDLALVQPLLADQTTAVGERRRLRLDDGSELELNTDTAVDLRFDATQRLVVLRRGELFVSCRAEQRPFCVETPHGRFETRDAAFSVRLGRGGAGVGVERGQVTVAGNAAEQVSAGQRYRLRDGQLRPLRDRGLEPGAWRDGLIVTRDMRLGDFLREVDRYRSGHLGYAEGVADLRLSGVFRLDDTDELLRVVAQTLPVRVRYLTRWWVRVDAV